MNFSSSSFLKATFDQQSNQMTINKAFLVAFAMACTATVALPLSSYAAGSEKTVIAECQKTRPILGFITLDQTTLGGATKTLKNRGCNMTIGGNGAGIKPGCFKLPGNPSVLLQSDWANLYPEEAEKSGGLYSPENMPETMAQSPVVRIVISLGKYSDFDWTEYANSLKRVWGEPQESDSKKPGGLPRFKADWKNNYCEITLENFKKSTILFIYESVKWLQDMAEREAAAIRKKNQEMDSLL